MKLTKTNKIRTYSIKTSQRGLDAELITSLPHVKRAKTLKLKTGKKTLTLNGHQIYALKRVFAKENLLKGTPDTIYTKA